MIDFNDMLAELVMKEIVSSREAMYASPNADEAEDADEGDQDFLGGIRNPNDEIPNDECFDDGMTELRIGE